MVTGTPLDHSLENAFAGIFKNMLTASRAYHDNNATTENVFQPAIKQNRPLFSEVCSKLMKSGSSITGLHHLIALSELAKDGESCLVCAMHTSNLDVPNFYTLMKNQGNKALDCFDRIVFVAGRKLNEDSPATKMLTEMFSRVVLSPKSYFDTLRPEEVKRRTLAKQTNIAAIYKILELSNHGHILLLYPTGTRTRPDKPESSRALKETATYLRMFENLCFMNVLGNTLPPVLSNNLVSEIPHYDVVKFIVGPIVKTKEWLQSATDHSSTNGYSKSERKQLIADMVMQEINKLV
ncbi:MAG: 1-acyl-sn-glycerol-3-phosphate acyltransferase [Candidatus Anammoxibacter sp.]